MLHGHLRLTYNHTELPLPLDTEIERNIILKELYPELRTMCENLKLDFQLVDMRWGIKDSASLDHSTEKICLREIRNCMNVSAGPNFVVSLFL